MQTATPHRIGHSRRIARGQLTRRSPLCGSHLSRRSRALIRNPTATHFCRESRTCQVAALSAEHDRLHTSFRDPRLSHRDLRPSYRNRRPGSRSPSRDDTASTLCWCYRRFGARAQKCTQGKLMQQRSTAAHICATTIGRLFITDRLSKRQLQVDTGSDLCVYPRRFIPRCKKRIIYDLCAADGTTNYTY
jgi:hypothetical protein